MIFSHHRCSEGQDQPVLIHGTIWAPYPEPLCNSRILQLNIGGAGSRTRAHLLNNPGISLVCNSTLVPGGRWGAGCLRRLLGRLGPCPVHGPLHGPLSLGGLMRLSLSGVDFLGPVQVIVAVSPVTTKIAVLVSPSCFMDRFLPSQRYVQSGMEVIRQYGSL